MSGILNWLASTGLALGILLVATVVAMRIGSAFIKKLVKKAVVADPTNNSQHARDQRYKTLSRILASIYKLVILVVALIISLSILGVDTTPLIAGMGIFGLAISFGAQDLIKDVVAGIFILLENQYRIGDIVELEGASGKVEKMTLRITVLRSMDGNVHYVPNGAIKQATNKTMEFSKVNLAIGVNYDSDIDLVEKTINKIGEQIAKEAEWKDDITETPHFLRVTELGESSVEVKVIGKTKPNKQWGVTGELRRRLLKAFAKEGIDIPYPQMVIHKK